MEQETKLYNQLKNQGIRLFNLTINNETTTFIHNNKKVEEWRKDLREAINEAEMQTDNDSESNISGSICGNLNLKGYVYINELISDVFEGEIEVTSFKIVDHIDHEGQSDGFGHYGFHQMEKLI